VSGIARQLRRPIVWLPISIGLLLLLAWRARLWEAGSRLAIVEPALLAVALAVNLATVGLWAARSSDLLSAAGRPVPIGPLVPMTSFANTINNLTPGSAGEIVRVWLLRAHHDVDYTTGAAVVAIERLLAFGYLAGSAGVLWFTGQGQLSPIVAIALLVGLAVAPWLAYRAGLRPSAIIRAIPGGRLVGNQRWERGATWLAGVDETVAIVLHHPIRLLVFVGLTAALFACFASQLVLVAGALGTSLAPVPAWGALGLSMCAGILSLLPFGLGSADVVLVALLGVIGLDPAVATATAFGYRLVVTLPLGLAGVASYAWLSARLPTGGAEAAVVQVGSALAEQRAADDPRMVDR
jgi:uncharacterized protein (TIRG00374 family)